MFKVSWKANLPINPKGQVRCLTRSVDYLFKKIFRRHFPASHALSEVGCFPVLDRVASKHKSAFTAAMILLGAMIQETEVSQRTQASIGHTYHARIHMTVRVPCPDQQNADQFRSIPKNG